MVIVGGTRVTHLMFLGVDPVFLRFCGLHRLPSDRTVAAWLKAFMPPALEALSDLIRDLVWSRAQPQIQPSAHPERPTLQTTT
jgi:hypothetical protein